MPSIEDKIKLQNYGVFLKGEVFGSALGETNDWFVIQAEIDGCEENRVTRSRTQTVGFLALHFP